VKDFERGYPNLATFADSDESFGLYRRHGYLQSRILLEKQDQLRCLELELDDLDRNDKYDDPDSLFTRQAQGDRRKRILKDAESTFREYGMCLASSSLFMA
jgi:hypothetical protein